MSTRRIRPADVGILAAYVGVALLWILPAFASGSVHLVGGPDVSDAPEQAWLLTWVPYSLLHGLNPFYTHLIDYPHGANLLWPGAPIPLGLLVWPLTAGLGPAAAYDGALVLAISTGAFTAYLCCRRWVRHRWAAVVGGSAFGFSPFVTGQVSGGHLVFVAVALVPLALLLMDELVVRQRWTPRRTGMLLGTVATAQVLIAEEFLAGLALIGGLGLVMLAARNAEAIRSRVGRVLRGLGWALAVFIPASAYPLWFQFLGPGSIHGQLYSSITYSANPASFVIPDWHQAITSPVAMGLIDRWTGNGGEVGAYLGLPMLIVLVAVYRRRPDKAAMFFALTAAAIAVLCLGPTLRLGPVDTHIPMPEAIIAALPVVNNLLPIRLTLYLDLVAAIVLSIYLDQLTWRPTDRWRRILGLLAVAFWLPSVTAPVIAAPVPRFFTSPALQADHVLLVLPVAEDAASDIGMLWQAAGSMRFAMPEGYYHLRAPDGVGSTDGPPLTPLTAALTLVLQGGAVPAVTPRLRRETWSYLREHQVTAVVAGPQANLRRTVELVSRLLQASPDIVGGVHVWQLAHPTGSHRA